MASILPAGGRHLLFVMATDHEYGPMLRQRIDPLITGVGPVEAAVELSAALAGMTRLPDLVVSLGSAGSRRKPVGEIFQISEVSWRDIDASRIGIPKGQTPFLDVAPVQPLATPIAWPTATLSTGANVVGGKEYDAIHADLVDMETWAILRACQHFGLPLMGLRGVSDGPGELEALGGWTALLGVLDERLAAAVDVLLRG
ncbi:MAG: 5'-methylthioadenosine/S-adenosylhomocysteine nucleosidase [Sphingomonadales bacterium]|nr:MAG: 5'-methylthioadenosine/S-adenosylhomocysteine nucleosidase [Sphingomonadales bacterium]